MISSNLKNSKLKDFEFFSGRKIIQERQSIFFIENERISDVVHLAIK